MTSFFSGIVGSGKSAKGFGTNLGKSGLGAIKNIMWK